MQVCVHMCIYLCVKGLKEDGNFLISGLLSS